MSEGSDKSKTDDICNKSSGVIAHDCLTQCGFSLAIPLMLKLIKNY